MGIPLHCLAFCVIAWVLEFDADAHGELHI